MPILHKKIAITIDKDSKFASGQMIPRTSDTVTSQDIGLAFQHALDAFKTEFGRDPNWDQMSFLGGITTDAIHAEIVEIEA